MMELRPSQLLKVAPANPTTPNTRYRQGQLVMGKITKWLGDGLAEVEIGGKKMTANVDISLKAGQRYPFQVQKEEANGLLHLRVVGSEGDQGHALNDILRGSGLPVNAQNRDLLSQLMEKNWPLVPSFVKKTVELSQGLPVKEAISVMEEMVGRDLPLDQEVFKAIRAVKMGPSSSSLLSQLEELLQPSAEDGEKVTPSSPQANQGLHVASSAVLPSTKADQGVKEEVATQAVPAEGRGNQQAEEQASLAKTASSPVMKLKNFIENLPTQTNLDAEKPLTLPQLLEKMGFFHESMVAQLSRDAAKGQSLSEAPLSVKQASTLKGELLSFLQANQSVNDSHPAQQLLHHLTGQQLLSLTHDPEWLSLNVQVPIFQNGERNEARVKWEIKKTPEGSFDAHFCRLIFHVHLSQLHETILQMVIQDRSITCSLYTETIQGKQLLDPAILEEIKTRLKGLNYNLLGFHHRTEEVQEVAHKLFHQTPQMDVSI